MIEEATLYAYKPLGKKARPLNLGFQCFMRHFESTLQMPLGALFGFLSRVLPREGICGEAYDYRILRRLTKEERWQLLRDGVLRHGIVPPKSLANQAHMAKLGNDEFASWIKRLVDAYEDCGEPLSKTHPLVIILRHGSGYGFDQRVTPWWAGMPPVERCQVVEAIVRKRPDVLFTIPDNLSPETKCAAWRQLGSGPVEVAQNAARQMSSFNKIRAGELFEHLTVPEIATLLDRLSTKLHVRAIHEAIRAATSRGELQEAADFTRYFPEAQHVSADVREVVKFYQDSFMLKPEAAELAAKVRESLMEALVRNGWAVKALGRNDQGFCVEHEGHVYVPRKRTGGTDNFSLGEVVVFKPVREAEQNMLPAIASMMSLGHIAE